jgi:mannose-6-phosphate isomerase
MKLPDSFISRPHKLFNKIQHYDWGSRNEAAFIPRLLGEKVCPDTPYAELWIGTHPKASSEIVFENSRITLKDVIDRYPVAMLGKSTAEKFNNSLPYLFKVLSAEKALSIQTHPNKSQAVKLHEQDPVNYPDSNHKPEIAVALDNLKTLCGFMPVESIKQNLIKYPELVEFSGYTNSQSAEEFYRAIIQQSNNKKKIKATLTKLKENISLQKNPEAAEKEFLRQYEIFGNDIGLFSFFFFNFLELHEGQGIFTDAGVPHAYIKGNIVECMANSDNVVRAGLTTKFTDVDTLLDVLHFDFKTVKILEPNTTSEKTYYNPGAAEFYLLRIETKHAYSEQYASNDKPRLILVIDGNIEVSYGNEKMSFAKGESVFLPAALKAFTLSSTEMVKLFIVEIP